MTSSIWSGRIRRLLPRFLHGSSGPVIIREAAWLVSGFVLKAIIQIGTLYYLTHNLGVQRVGTFYAVLSFFAIVVPFAQLGNYDLTVRQIAQGEYPPLVAGRAMRSTFASFVFLLPIVLSLKPLVSPQVGWIAFLPMAVSELFVMRVHTNVVAVATGFRLHYISAISDFAMGLLRFIVVYTAAQLLAGLNELLALYAFTSVPVALGAYIWLIRRIGRPMIRSVQILADLGDHITMVIAWFLEMVARDGDKLLLTEFSSPLQTGIYGTAVRLFSVTLVPIDILSQVFRPRLSRARAEGKRRGARIWAVMAVCLCGCGVVGGAGLFLAAYVLPLLAPNWIKSDFADVRSAIMYLAFVPPIYGLQRANAIDAIARGAIKAYAAGTAAGVVFGMGTLIILAPSYGWRSACFGSMIYFAVSSLTTWLFSRNFSTIFPIEHVQTKGRDPTPDPLLNEELEATKS
jgi:O-antigen/teichoic acid export membrane protein